MTHAHRLLLKWARLVHVYLTLFGLALLLFFAVTGFMLNHEDWFSSGEPHTSTVTGLLPSGSAREPYKLAVVEALRKDFGVTGAVDSFDEEEESLRVVFKSPGRTAEASVRRENGHTVVTLQSRGLVGVLTDLHRGKSSGWVWGLIIDAVCVLFLVVSATGLVLWSSLRSRGKHGLAVIGFGLLGSVAVYWLFVP
jgi:hypothetical protein